MNYDTNIPALPLEKIPSPCFVLNEKRLIENLELLGHVQAVSGAKIILALKGFAMFRAFPLVKKYLPGVTASALNEALLGKHEFGGEIHAYSPAYHPAEIDELLSVCNHISFNSLAEYERHKKSVELSGRNIECGLRINPGYSEVKTDLYNPCIRGSRLGVTEEMLGDTLPEGITGLHFHSLCENHAETLEKTLESVEEKFGHLLHQAKWLNMGGGHWITGKGYNVELLISLIKRIREKYKVEVILEPGSAVGWQTGYLVATVLDVVENEGTVSAMLDTSFSAHMPDTIEMPYKPKVWQATEEKTAFKYNLGGSTCLAGDFQSDYYFNEPLKPGDKLIFDDMMHYTMVKTTTFNGINLPSIGIWKENGDFELVRSYGYEEYKSRLS